MSIITRTPLCTYKRCPFPTDPWAHACTVCEAPAVEHHHKEPRGMGGSKVRDVKENIIMLCPDCHKAAHGLIGAVTGRASEVGGGQSVKTNVGDHGLPEALPAGASGASSATTEGHERIKAVEPSAVAPGASAFTSRPEQDAGADERAIEPATDSAPSVSLKEQA